MRKIDDVGKKTEGGMVGKKETKIMSEIVATNVVTSGPPKRRPTGMPTACANYL